MASRSNARCPGFTIPNYLKADLQSALHWLLLGCALLVSAVAGAQTFPLQIQVSVVPPYSAYLQDYAGAGQQVRIVIINTSQTTYQVRLTGQLTGDNGVDIRTSANYRPLRPLTVPPGQKLLTRADLEGLFDLNQIEVAGIDKSRLAQGLPLPDGFYQLCVRAYNEGRSATGATLFGQPLSAEFPIGCSAPIQVRAVEPPILVAPLCDAEVMPVNPQALVFTWTPPVGMSPAQVEYTLRVVELPQVNIDPNVFIDAVALPRSGVEVRNLRTGTFLYGPTQPPLTPGKRYAWRVQAIDRSKKLNFLNDGKSPVCVFTYGSGPIVQLASNPGVELTQTPSLVVPVDGLNTKIALPEANTLLAQVSAPKAMKGEAPVPPAINCNTGTLPADKNPVTAAIDGKTLKIGAFDLVIYKASAQGSSFSGEGRITWNKAPVRVTFNGLKVNAAGQVFEGLVSSTKDGAGMPAISLGQIDAYGGLPKDYFSTIKNDLLEAGKQAATISLPLKYEAKLGTVGVNQMQFSPTGAQMDMVLGVSVPEAGLDLFLAATNVCMSPDKTLPNTAMLYLIKDFPLPIPGGIGQKLVVKKSDAPKINGTYASVVNGEFTKVHGVLDLNLGSSLLKLDDGAGNVKAGDVVGTITADFEQWSDWYGIVTLPAFQLPVLKGLTFTGKDIVYDHSDKTNAPGCTFPDEYKGDKGNTFRGFYFNDLLLELPGSLKSDPRISVTVKGGVLDESGFTGVVKAAKTPVIDYNKNTLAGFGFSVDDINMLIVHNSFRSGGMYGRLQFPISDDAFSYSCNLSGGFDNMQFTVTPKDGYNVPLFAANMDLAKTTNIKIVIQKGQKATIDIQLDGQVAVDVKKFAGSGAVGSAIDATLPKLYFEDFTIRNQKLSASDKALGGSGLFLNTGAWSLTNDVAKKAGGKPSGGGPADAGHEELFAALADDTQPGTLAGFPIDFDTPTIVATGQGAGIRLGIGVHLGEEAEDASFVQAHGTVDILGDVKTENGRFKPVYNGTYPNSLSISGNIGVLKVSGGLTFFYNDGTYGNGMKGNAKVDIPSIGTGISMVMLFGKKEFHYAMLDANVQFSPGISMVGPLMLTGFGGGMHYNMTMSGTPADVSSATSTPVADLKNIGKTPSGLVYKPASGNWGITARVLVGLADIHVFNSSLELTVNFKGGGFNSFAMIGKGTVISKNGDPAANDGMITTTLVVKYTPGMFDVELDADAKFVGTTVKVPFRMHFASSEWFVKLGDPYDLNARVSLKLIDVNTSIVSAHLTLSGYVAAGNVFSKLPPLPDPVIKFLNVPDADAEVKKAYASRKMTYPEPVSTGKKLSILFGGRVDGDLNVQLMPFRCHAKAVVGFDAGLQQGVTCGGGGPPDGLNGWYGQGQGYAYFNGGIDLYVDVWFFEGSVNIMDLTAAVLFQGGFMNPTWAKGNVRIRGSALDGLVSVDTRQSFSMGEICTPVFNGDPLADIDIIQDLTPTTGSADVNVRPVLGATFNIPVSKLFTVLIPTGEVRQYIFKVDTPTLMWGKKAGNGGTGMTTLAESDQTPISWTPDKKAFTRQVKPFLMSNAYCTFKVSVNIYEIVNGFQTSPYIDKLKKREPRSQSKSASFTLGKQPDAIPLDLVDISWPLPDQHYFLKKQASQGFVRMLPEVSLKGLDIVKPDPKKELVALFQEQGGATLTSPVLVDGDNKLTFNLPGALKNSQVYRLEIRSREKAPAVGQPGNAGIITTAYKNTGQKGIMYQQTSFNANVLKALAAADVANAGQELFGLVFRTSQYNTFAEKINSLQLSGDYLNRSAFGPNAGLIELNTKADAELFDDFEISGGQIYNRWYQPAMWFDTPIGNSKFDQEMKTRVYDVMTKWNTDGGEYYQDCCQPNPKYGKDYPGDSYDVECWQTLDADNLFSCDPKRNTGTLLPTNAMMVFPDIAKNQKSGKVDFGSFLYNSSKKSYAGYMTSPTGVNTGVLMGGQAGGSGNNDPRFTISPVETGMVTKFVFERDRYMMNDLVALMYFMKQMRHQFEIGIQNNCLYSYPQMNNYPDPMCTSFNYVAQQMKQLMDKPVAAKPKQDPGNQTNGTFTVNSKTLGLYGRFYMGRFLNDKQWKIAYDDYYKTIRIDYDDINGRTAADGFDVVFKYSLDAVDDFTGTCRSEKGQPEFPLSKVTKKYFITGAKK